MRMKQHMILPLLVLVALGCSHAQVSQQDSMALVALYNATNGSEWTVADNWLSGQPVGEWHGIVVNNGRVEQIYLHDNNLSGTLPSEIGDLTSLNRIDICCNLIGGEIPESIGNLTALELLDIYVNEFTGTFPDSLANCQALQSVVAYKNDFSGGFPSVFFELPNLVRLELGSNEFSGPLNPGINQMTQIRILTFDRNDFSGQMVPIRDLVNLTELHLSGNQLTGEPGDFLGYHPDLYYATFGSNAFSGCFSDTFFNPLRIEFLHFENNQIDCIGDFSAFADTGVLRRINVSTNVVPFEFLEPNRHVPDFFYSFQKPLLSVEEHTLSAGDSLDIDAGSGGMYTVYQWFKDSKTIPGETSRILKIRDFQAEDEGVYHCEMTNDSLPELTLRRSPVTLSLEGTSAIRNQVYHDLAVHPNPATDQLVLETGSSDAHDIMMMDATGRQVPVEVASRTESSTVIDIQRLRPGMYHLVIRTTESAYAGRFVKQ